MHSTEKHIIHLPSDLNPQVLPYSFADERIKCEDDLRHISVDGNPVRLTKRESSILSMLGSNPDGIVVHELLISAAMGAESLQLPRDTLLDVLKVHVNHIRNKLGRDDLGATTTGSLRTYRSLGYGALSHLEEEDPQ